MTDNEYGPFTSEAEAMATRSAALVKAAFDAAPGYGASVPECLKVMTDECEASGVALGKLDLSFLKGVAWGETFYSVSLAGMIHRAFEAGKAAMGETRECRHCGEPITRCPDAHPTVPEFPPCKGWRHAGYDAQPVSGHCCGGCATNPVAEPGEEAGDG